MKNYSGRILLRVSSELHSIVTEHATALGQSVNEYITQSIQNRIDEERVGLEVANSLSFPKVTIDDLKVKDVREAAIVTQHPWYMELLRKYNIYFFNPKLGRITPMQYLLFYETTKQEDNGIKNKNPRHIAQYGKVKEIIFDIQPEDYKYVPELEPITRDNNFWPKIENWGISNVVIMDEVGDFKEPIPLKNGLEARYLVNKTTSLSKIRNANYVDELY